MEKLTHSEEEAMLIVWQLGRCNIKEVLDNYQEPKPPYTTLASVIKKLESKKYLKAELGGNAYRYTPLISQEEYKNSFLSDVVENYFGSSFQNMVTFFAKKEKISTDELREVIRLIEKGQF